jgi:Leucine-rich repeat (LRR) protein
MIDNFWICFFCQELYLTANHLVKIPAFIGEMTGLKQLLLGNNKLTTLPFKLGFCTGLTNLQLYDNPLVDPPYEKVRMLDQI